MQIIENENNSSKKSTLNTTMTNSSVTGNGTGAYRGGIPLNVTLHAWPIPKLDTTPKQINDTNLIEKNNESAKNYTNSLHNLNATGYVAIEDDLTDTGLTDVQTFILAGVATVIPLLVLVITILGIRFLWRRYRAKKEDGYEGVLQKEESSEPLGKLQSYSLPQELKTSESQFTVAPDDFTSTPSTQLPTPKSNGSVITMTLKNNHLIVETEETVNTPEGIKIESKGTTTKFVTSRSSNFRFEGATEEPPEKHSTREEMPSLTDHGALVHYAPEETEDELERGSCNTGLSQSDLSVSSTESQNPSYRYGNQMGYDSGAYGYPEYSGYSTFASKNESQKGPKTHKIYARGFSVDCTQIDGLVGGPAFKDILMSDIQAREKRVQDKKNEEESILRNGELTITNSGEVLPPLDPTSTPTPEAQQLQKIQTKSESIQLDKSEYLTNSEVNAEENKS